MFIKVVTKTNWYYENNIDYEYLYLDSNYDHKNYKTIINITNKIKKL